MAKSLEDELADVFSAAYPLAETIARTLPDHGESSHDRRRLIKAVDGARLDAVAVPWLGRLLSERCISIWGLGGLCHLIRDIVEQPWSSPTEKLSAVLRDRLPPHHPGERFELMLRNLDGR